MFSIFSGKYFNQNLICVILAYLGVFFAHKYDFCCLCHMCWVLFILSIITLFLTLIFYTWEYCAKKIYKANCHRLRYKLTKKIIKNPEENKGKENGKSIITPSDIIGW